MIGVIGWAAILTLVLLWEGAALITRTPDWPTLSDIMRIISRPLLGRWALFALWMWAGWHLFVRGWMFFLQGAPRSPSLDPGARSNGQAAVLTPVAGEPLFGTEVTALLTLYVVVLALLAYCGIQIGRNARAVYRAEPQAGWRAAASHVGITILGGCCLFLVALVVYYMAIARESTHSLLQVVAEALSLTALVVVPGFAALTILYRLRGAARGGLRARDRRFPNAPLRRNRKTRDRG